MAKIILTEKQFKDYMRIVLQEKRSADYAKKILNETLNGIENGKEEFDLQERSRNIIQKMAKQMLYYFEDGFETEPCDNDCVYFSGGGKDPKIGGEWQFEGKRSIERLGKSPWFECHYTYTSPEGKVQEGDIEY